MVEIDEWHPPAAARPEGPESFPASGVNSLAPIWQRWVARLIDSALLAIPFSVLVTVVWLVSIGGDPDRAAESAPVDPDLTWGALIAMALVYETVCVTYWGQTLGKLMVGIRVARVGNGRSPLWWEAGIRVALPGSVAAIPHPLAKFVSMGLLAAAMFDPMRRSVADRAAGTVVVRSR